MDIRNKEPVRKHKHMTASKIICVDFDGTIAKHKYPDIGEEVPGAIAIIKSLQQKGHRIILYTMRHDSSKEGPMLSNAIEWCKQRGLEFWGHNHNPEQKDWSLSPKVYGNIYIDDAALGCPLFYSLELGERPWVDWSGIFDLLAEKGYFDEEEYKGQ